MVDTEAMFIGKIARIIEKREDSPINWEFLLETFGFNCLLEHYPRLIKSHEFGDDDYPSNLIGALKLAYTKNKDNTLLMVKYIFDEYLKLEKEDFSKYKWLKEFLENDDFEIVIPSLPAHERIIKDLHETNIKTKASDLKVFISYSTHEKSVAAKIKGTLEYLGIKSFMAHEDIEVSEEWKQCILKELEHADIFIPILSENFRNSDWCSQEAGIAGYRDILIIPLSLDGLIPYGFINHRQGKPITEDDIPMKYLLKPVINNFPEIDILDLLINQLKESRSYRSAEHHMKILTPYFDKLSEEQINNIVDVSIANNQILPADLCRKEYLPAFIEINKDKINETKLKKLLKMIGKA